jgi:hypothetical protein
MALPQKHKTRYSPFTEILKFVVLVNRGDLVGFCIVMINKYHSYVITHSNNYLKYPI